MDNNWSLNNGINNEIEFDFDSFGPESIIYTGNDNLEEPHDLKPKQSLSEETLNAGIYHLILSLFQNSLHSLLINIFIFSETIESDVNSIQTSEQNTESPQKMEK